MRPHQWWAESAPPGWNRVKVSEISVVELISTFEAKDEDPETVKALFTDASANDEDPETLKPLTKVA